MPRTRTALEVAAGKLVLAVQKEWNAEMGTPSFESSFSALDRATELLQAATSGALEHLLGTDGVADYLGELWVSSHPSVLPAINALESLLGRGQDA